MAAKKQTHPKVENDVEDAGEANEMLIRDKQIDEVKSLIVFLWDKTGIHFTLEDAPLTQCSGLQDLVIREQNLPTEASSVFCLWLISPILELRLKKHHNPFQVVQKWDQLCALYTDASSNEISASEPVLMLQRDVFYSKEEEKKIENEQILSLLYHEAKGKVIDGRYILHEEDYHSLAGIQAVIQLGLYDQSQHSLLEYRSNLAKFYPEHMYIQSRFSFLNRSSIHQASCEEAFRNSHREKSTELRNLVSQQNLNQLYKKYLEILWSYPFYGGAFFSGAVETRISGLRRLIPTRSDMRVRVCINNDGVSIFSVHKDEFILYVPYDEMSWMYQDLEWDGDNNPPPTLLLQFMCDETHEESQGQPVTKLLQIYSQEAKLMDALIETCVNRKLEQIKESPGIDFIDSGLRRKGETSVKKMLNKLDKLSLETYTKDGEQLETV